MSADKPKRTKDDHFTALFETSTAVRPFVERWAYANMPSDLQAVIAPSIERCLARRRDGPLLRPLLTRMCYEVCGGGSWRDVLPILAAVELLNISTYQSNYCFDEKAGIATAERNNQFICSMLSFSVIPALVESSTTVTTDAKCATIALLARSNHEVYQGQFYDLNILNLDCVSDFSSADAFYNVYAKRCDLIAGSTFRACAAGAIVNGLDVPPLQALYRYLGCLGAAAQVVNDLGDYIPHVTKDYALPFSDLQLGRLTLPTFLLYQGGAPILEWRHRLRNEAHAPDVESALAAAIGDLAIEARARAFIQSRFFEDLRKALADLRRYFGDESTQAFRFAYPYIFDSRLLRYFRADRSRAWPT